MEGIAHRGAEHFLELRGGGDHKGVAFLAQEIDVVPGDRRGGVEFLLEIVLPMFLPIRQIDSKSACRRLSV